jgi:hypothetical protein
VLGCCRGGAGEAAGGRAGDAALPGGWRMRESSTGGRAVRFTIGFAGAPCGSFGAEGACTVGGVATRCSGSISRTTSAETCGASTVSTTGAGIATIVSAVCAGSSGTGTWTAGTAGIGNSAIETGGTSSARRGIVWAAGTDGLTMWAGCARDGAGATVAGGRTTGLGAGRLTIFLSRRPWALSL